MIARVQAAALGLAFALVACGDGEATGPASIELGTGDRRFEPIADGDDIFVVQGPQDGYHLFGSLRALNVEAGDADDLSSAKNPTTRFEVYVGNERVDAMASTYVQGLREDDEGYSVMIGRTVILDIADDSELAGQTLRFVVELVDVNGEVVQDERNLVAGPHPSNL